MFSKEDHYEWYSATGGDSNFPTQVIEGAFYDKEGKYITWVPSGKMQHSAWGDFFGSYIVGSDSKALPAKVEVTYYSYGEDKFYQTTVDIDYEKTKALFKAGFTLNYTNGKTAHENYSTILLGAAPGGAVAVWAHGLSHTVVEIGFGVGKEVERNFGMVHQGSPSFTKEEWIKIEMHGQNGALKDESFKYLNDRDQINRKWYTWDEIKKNGVPLGIWPMYREQYDWKIVFEGKGKPTSLVISSFNGEITRTRKVQQAMKITQVAPREVALGWIKPDGEKMGLTIVLNEEEIFPAFQKLAKANEKIQFVITFYENLVSTVKLRNSREEIKIKGRKILER